MANEVTIRETLFSFLFFSFFHSYFHLIKLIHFSLDSSRDVLLWLPLVYSTAEISEGARKARELTLLLNSDECSINDDIVNTIPQIRSLMEFVKPLSATEISFLRNFCRKSPMLSFCIQHAIEDSVTRSKRAIFSATNTKRISIPIKKSQELASSLPLLNDLPAGKTEKTAQRRSSIHSNCFAAISKTIQDLSIALSSAYGAKPNSVETLFKRVFIFTNYKQVFVSLLITFSE